MPYSRLQKTIRKSEISFEGLCDSTINVRTTGSTAITAFRSMSPFPVRPPPEVTSVIIEPLMNLIFVSVGRYSEQIAIDVCRKILRSKFLTGKDDECVDKREREASKELDVFRCTHVIVAKKFRVHQRCFRLENHLVQKLRIRYLHYVQITGRVFGRFRG